MSVGHEDQVRRARVGVAARVLAVLLVLLTITAGRSQHGVPTAPPRAAQRSASTVDTDHRHVSEHRWLAGNHLDPALHRQIDRAISAAAADGVELGVTSGWRSPAEQERLYQAAIRTYGSPAAAAQWVLPPDRSAHVSGAAVDVGPRAGAAWLETHGARFGLCRRYDNEWWHFELLAPTDGSGVCPARAPHAGAQVAGAGHVR